MALFDVFRTMGTPNGRGYEPPCPQLGPQDVMGYVATSDFFPTLGTPYTAYPRTITRQWTWMR